MALFLFFFPGYLFVRVLNAFDFFFFSISIVLILLFFFEFNDIITMRQAVYTRSGSCIDIGVLYTWSVNIIGLSIQSLCSNMVNLH